MSDDLAGKYVAAVGFHQRGNLAEAETLYRQVIQANPYHADALHLLGVVTFQRGDNAAAEEMLRKAIALKGRAADIRFNLATVLAAVGKGGEAEAELRVVLGLRPQDAGALSSLADLLQARGAFDEAEECFRRAVRLNPLGAEGHFNLGNLLKLTGKSAEAEAELRQAIHFDPGYADAYTNLGGLLCEQGRLEEAQSHLKTALQLRGDSPEALNTLAVVMRGMGRLEEAEALLNNAATLKPDYAESYNNLGAVLRDMGRLEEAEAALRVALRLRADYASAHANLGNVLLDRMRTDQAKAEYLEALRLNPDYVEGHWNIALLYLMNGDFEQGWREYEWRLKRGELKHLYPDLPAPLWLGEDLAGKTLLLYAEQGLGDTLQFVRLAPLLAQRGGRVILECQPALKRLLASAAGIEQVVAKGDALPPFDFQCPLLSLPQRLNVTLDSIPAEMPYLKAETELSGRWRERLGKYPGLKVGLVWAGDPRKSDLDAHRIDRRRSMSFVQFSPLFGIAGVSLFSLQKGEASVQAEREIREGRLTDFTNELGDFADTAALVGNLDLVISVDTAVAHLAGALGKSVWLLSRFDGCWRWLLERDDTPWYPTMQLFRQQQQGDWAGVISRVAKKLGETAKL